MGSHMSGIPVAFLQRLAVRPAVRLPAVSRVHCGNRSGKLLQPILPARHYATTRCTCIYAAGATAQRRRPAPSLGSDSGPHTRDVRAALSKRRKDIAQQIHNYGRDTTPSVHATLSPAGPLRPGADARRQRQYQLQRQQTQSLLQQSSKLLFDAQHALQLWQQYMEEPGSHTPFIVRQKLFGELTLMFQPYVQSISQPHNQFVRDVLCDALHKGLYLDRRLLNTCLHMLNVNGYGAYAIDVFQVWTATVGSDVSTWRLPNQYTFGVMTQIAWLAIDSDKSNTLTVQQLLAAKVKYNVDLDTRAYNALLSIANRDRQYVTAIEIYEQHMLPQAERQGQSSNNADDDDDAPELHNKVRDNQDCTPNQQTLSLVTASYIYGQQIDKGIEIYNTIREAHLAGETTFTMNIKLIQPIVIAAIEQNMLPVAQSIVQQMHEDGIEHDKLFAEKVTRFYLLCEHHAEAVHAFKTLLRPVSKPSIGFYAYIVMHLRAFKKYDLEQQLLQMMEDDGYARHNLEQKVIILQGQVLSKKQYQMADFNAEELVAALRASNKITQSQQQHST